MFKKFFSTVAHESKLLCLGIYADKCILYIHLYRHSFIVTQYLLANYSVSSPVLVSTDYRRTKANPFCPGNASSLFEGER